MCFVVLWQVISRFIVRNPSRWSEEVARYLMIWITFLASTIGITNKTHLGLTMAVNSIKNRKVRLSFRIFQYLCIIAFSLALFLYGLSYAIEGNNQTGMSIMIKMSLVYSVIPISGFFIIVNSIENIIEEMKTFKNGRRTRINMALVLF